MRNKKFIKKLTTFKDYWDAKLIPKPQMSIIYYFVFHMFTFFSIFKILNGFFFYAAENEIKLAIKFEYIRFI